MSRLRPVKDIEWVDIPLRHGYQLAIRGGLGDFGISACSFVM
jgi:hypothetical protein